MVLRAVLAGGVGLDDLVRPALDAGASHEGVALRTCRALLVKEVRLAGRALRGDVEALGGQAALAVVGEVELGVEAVVALLGEVVVREALRALLREVVEVPADRTSLVRALDEVRRAGLAAVVLVLVSDGAGHADFKSVVPAVAGIASDAAVDRRYVKEAR